MKPKILVVDDELSMCEFLEIFLVKEGYEVTTAQSGQAACDLLERERFDLVITDLKMPQVSGLDVLRTAKKIDSQMPVLIITAFAAHDSAVEAMKLGALDYIVKPFKIDEVRHFVGQALERRQLSKENIALRRQLGERYGFGSLIGSDPRMMEIYEMIRRIAATPTNVLITGDTGTGKELVARAIHVNSRRGQQPFVVINCGAIPAELLESELFGHIKGSYTGAVSDKKGLFEVAEGGTLFLDEVGELPAAMQVKLLRALQERKIMRVGSTRETPIDVRIISATNRDLEKEVRNSRFREDLYYRLNVIQINMPPLRERRGDIRMLAEYFLEKYTRALGKPVHRISSEVMKLLESYHYPGNVRELENIIERAVALEREDVIMIESLPAHLIKQSFDISSVRRQLCIPPEGLDLDDVLQAIEKDFIHQALQRSSGSKKGAAGLLGLTFRSFRYRLSKLNLDLGPNGEEGDEEEE